MDLEEKSLQSNQRKHHYSFSDGKLIDRKKKQLPNSNSENLKKKFQYMEFMPLKFTTSQNINSSRLSFKKILTKLFIFIYFLLISIYVYFYDWSKLDDITMIISNNQNWVARKFYSDKESLLDISAQITDALIQYMNDQKDYKLQRKDVKSALDFLYDEKQSEALGEQIFKLLENKLTQEIEDKEIYWSLPLMKNQLILQNDL